MDSQQLADAMAHVGHQMARATIAKIEAGAEGAGGEVLGPRPEQKTAPRPVRLAEAVPFALALGVSSLSLFLPIRPGAKVHLTSQAEADIADAHAWARGDRPLTLVDSDATHFYRVHNYAYGTAPRVTLESLAALGIQVVGDEPDA